jgi:hypothetical protein
MKLLILSLLLSFNSIETNKDITLEATHSASRLTNSEYTNFTPCFILIRIHREEFTFVSRLNTRRYKILRSYETYVDSDGDVVSGFSCIDDYGTYCNIVHRTWNSINKRETLKIEYSDVSLLYIVKRRYEP